ncbi:hypothetical protein ACFX13_024431 [Malus domestica]
MSVFLGHHRNIDRVDDGTNNETLRQLFRTRSLASHTQVLSEPCNKEPNFPLCFATSSLQFKRKPISFLVTGREVKAIREDCPPGKVVYLLTLKSKEESKRVLSSISTSFPRRWKSRPAQRITGAI